MLTSRGKAERERVRPRKRGERKGKGRPRKRGEKEGEEGEKYNDDNEITEEK